MPDIEDKTIRRNIRDLLDSKGGLKANFVVLAGQDIGRKYQISKAVLVIGRHETSDIFIDDDDVSRTHAKVEVQADSIVLNDLGSTNGTLVNGTPVSQHRLLDGDRIQVGNTTILKFNFLDNLEDSFNEQLYNAANKDFLTQLYNKKYFLDRLKMEMSYSRRHERPLSLVMMDLDFFKRVNDNHGHVVGDKVLRQFANRLGAVKRHEDLLARYGGEEFALLLRDTAKDTAIQISEKLRARVEEFQFEIEGHKIVLSASIGLATFNRNNYKNHETFLRAADQQLYRAKKEGRNRVHYSREGLGESPPERPEITH